VVVPAVAQHEHVRGTCAVIHDNPIRLCGMVVAEPEEEQVPSTKNYTILAVRSEESMPERIGFVGLGIMGRPMAENLSKKFEVVGYDVQSSRLAGLPALAGFTAARGVADVGNSCGVVCLSLPSATYGPEASRSSSTT